MVPNMGKNSIDLIKLIQQLSLKGLTKTIDKEKKIHVYE